MRRILLLHLYHLNIYMYFIQFSNFYSILNFLLIEELPVALFIFLRPFYFYLVNSYVLPLFEYLRYSDSIRGVERNVFDKTPDPRLN